MSNALLEIWQPRYSTDEVLIAKWKLQTMNTIKFTKAKSLEGMEFEMSGADISKYPIETKNGGRKFHVVPMNVLLENKVNE